MGVLDGQIAIVTGAESGIGQAIATLFGREGAAVVVGEFAQTDGARATVGTIVANGGRAVSVLGSRASILVNDAGISPSGHNVVDTTRELWDQVLATNLTGPFLCSRRFLRTLRDRKERGGKIICITSVHQEMPALGVAAYCASKGGHHMFVKCLALEAAGTHRKSERTRRA